MAEPFLGQIIMFGGNFAPAGWAFCDGQELPIAQNTALFSILGTTYGGDGETTYGLPNLQGRVAVHEGGGKSLGQTGGQTSVALTPANIPPLNVTIPVSNDEAEEETPGGNIPAFSTEDVLTYTGIDNATENASLAGATTGGNSTAVNIEQPYQVVNYIIALQGIFPSPN